MWLVNMVDESTECTGYEDRNKSSISTLKHGGEKIKIYYEKNNEIFLEIEKRLKELGIMDDIELLVSGGGVLGGDCFTEMFVAYSGDRKHKFLLKYPIDVIGDEAARGWVTKIIKTAEDIKKAGGHVPECKQFFDGVLYQNYIDGVVLTRDTHIDGKYLEAIEYEKSVYKKIGLEPIDSLYGGNFVVMCNEDGCTAYCVDLGIF